MLRKVPDRQSAIHWTRAALDVSRQAIEAAHAHGATGMEVVTALSDLADEILRDLAHAHREGSSDVPGIALVALGGYGRRELAPYSDIDLMFLYAPDCEAQAGVLSTAILHHLWDLGFQVGHSLRTIVDCVALGQSDLTVRTALMEARRLAGDEALFEAFTRRYRADVMQKGVQEFIGAKLEERRQEYSRYGATNFLLEPNLKKGRGGLRDLHLLVWTALARHGTSSFEDLTAKDLLSADDTRSLQEAREFLWRTRNDLHFHAGRAQDVLTFEEQIRIAGLRGFTDLPHLLAVEQFMQQYYRHSTRVCDLATRFTSQALRGSARQRLAALWPGRRIEQWFVLTQDQITVPTELRKEALTDGARVIRLFQLAQQQGLRVNDDLVQELPERLGTIPDLDFLSEDARRNFLAILSGPDRVSDTLAAMHRVCLLERLIPAFGTVHGLMQFNAYHKYTVDHHSLLAVGQAEELGDGKSMLSQVYREIKRKDLLHLALLLHDLGKGQEDDHSLVGERIAQETAARLGLNEHETQLVMMLVRDHLLMAHTAFRRDLSDDKVVLRFARKVGTPEALKMLYVLTAADIAAVGPGVLTQWKETLLGELYVKTLEELDGEEGAEATEAVGFRRDEVRRDVLRAAGDRFAPAWLARHLEGWPDRWLFTMSVERIVAHLSWMARVEERSALVDVRHDDATGTTEYAVYARETLIPGIFSKIAGVLAAKGVQILDAQIATFVDGVVVDVFRVTDPDCPVDARARRFTAVSGAIVGVLEGRYTVEDLLRDSGRFGRAAQSVPLRTPTVVQVDTETSERYTILDVFADDRQGLLYVITRAIFDLGLSVHAARISTKLDQVVDVFYVTDQAGHKIIAPDRCTVISEAITARIEAFLGAAQDARPQAQRISCAEKITGRKP